MTPSSSLIIGFLSGHKSSLAAWLAVLFLTIRGDLVHGSQALTGLVGLVTFGLMMGCAFTVVRHADELAERLGEPYGTLLLTLSATAIETSLLLRVMLEGEENPTLLRDTIFATLMLVLNGLVGLALTAGGWRHIEQAFNLRGALAFLHMIAPLSLLILVLPNFTITPLPSLSPTQEVFIGVLCVLVYIVFLGLQMGRHSAHFDHISATSPMDEALWDRGGGEAPPRPPISVALSTAGLIFALLPIVLLSERLAETIEYGIRELHLPTALGGLVVTLLVLAPEGLSAIRAALHNRVQRSINICLGSALSTIALTIPSVLMASAWLGHSLILGVNPLNVTLLYATLIVAFITFVSGRANLLQGTVHIMLFLAYLFFMFNP